MAEENNIFIQSPLDGWKYGLQNNVTIEGEDNGLNFFMPNYGVQDFLNDRALWQYQLFNKGGEIGWFYFKIFFQFNTQYGLFGGLFTEGQENKEYYSQNSAIKYLTSISNRYKQSNIPNRIEALKMFGANIKNMAKETPWMFKGVNGLDKVMGAYTSNFDKDKEIEIVMNTETSDMRIGTMFDLYKYVCYDNINCKEILPSNLRKFDMCIMIYNIPIKGIQKTRNLFKTGVTSSSEMDKMMSFKLYSFMNCEISTESLNMYNQASMNNETAFNQGTTSFKITYDRVYEHRMNEWNDFFIGTDGIWHSNGVHN